MRPDNALYAPTQYPTQATSSNNNNSSSSWFAPLYSLKDKIFGESATDNRSIERPMSRPMPLQETQQEWPMPVQGSNQHVMQDGLLQWVTVPNSGPSQVVRQQVTQAEYLEYRVPTRFYAVTQDETSMSQERVNSSYPVEEYYQQPAVVQSASQQQQASQTYSDCSLHPIAGFRKGPLRPGETGGVYYTPNYFGFDISGPHGNRVDGETFNPLKVIVSANQDYIVPASNYLRGFNLLMQSMPNQIIDPLTMKNTFVDQPISIVQSFRDLSQSLSVKDSREAVARMTKAGVDAGGSAAVIAARTMPAHETSGFLTAGTLGTISRAISLFIDMNTVNGLDKNIARLMATNEMISNVTSLSYHRFGSGNYSEYDLFSLDSMSELLSFLIDKFQSQINRTQNAMIENVVKAPLDMLGITSTLLSAPMLLGLSAIIGAFIGISASVFTIMNRISHYQASKTRFEFYWSSVEQCKGSIQYKEMSFLKRIAGKHAEKQGRPGVKGITYGDFMRVRIATFILAVEYHLSRSPQQFDSLAGMLTLTVYKSITRLFGTGVQVSDHTGVVSVNTLENVILSLSMKFPK